MPLSDHNGKNSFNLNNKSFTNRGASGGTPIYDIASSGGSGGSGGGILASGRFQFSGLTSELSEIRADGISYAAVYGQPSFGSPGQRGYHFSLSTPIDTPIVNYSITNWQAAGGPTVQSIFYHTSDPTSMLSNWGLGGGYSGNVSSGNITDIVFMFFGDGFPGE